MSLLFLGLFPFFALTLYLPYANKVRHIHMPLQIFATIMLIIGMALGITLGTRIGELDKYHMIIGFVVVAILVLFQPALGLYQHLHYRKTGTRSNFGVAHRWLGRIVMVLGVINGGLGYQISGTTDAYIPYAVVAAIVFLIYISVIAFATWRGTRDENQFIEKKGSPTSGYEMNLPKQSRHTRLPSNSNTAYADQQAAGRSYTIRSSQ